MRQEIEKSIAKVCADLFNEPAEVYLTRPDEQFGDYATNVALTLSKKVGQNPREIAQQIVDKIGDSNEHIKSLSVAGPGFINVTLTDAALFSLANDVPKMTLEGKTVVAEYSDPNPFKVLHAGHLYTTIVGDTLALLMENAGAKLVRVNFGGDVGLHVGKAMWAILKNLGGENPGRLSDIDPSQRASWISARYVEGNTAYEENETQKAEIIEVNKRVYLLHEQSDKESDFAQVYWTCRQWSYDGFEALYEKLEIHKFDKYYPESETTPAGLELVKKGVESGFFKESQGAIVLEGEEKGLHTRVFMNSAGLPTYETKDLGLAATKWIAHKPDINIIITGNDITEYMKVVLEAVKNFYPEIAERTRHITHGNLKLVGGVKMSSRKGSVLLAEDILTAAHTANEDLENSNSSYETTLAAVKYAFVKSKIGGDIIYDPKESVAMEGNSGPYIQYAHARARSIIKKAGSDSSDVVGLEDSERSLTRKLGEYAETIEKATEELMPHHICTYLYELAQTFNSFYEANRVIGDPRQSQRLRMVEIYADTLKNGLGILNITAPESM